MQPIPPEIDPRMTAIWEIYSKSKNAKSWSTLMNENACDPRLAWRKGPGAYVARVPMAATIVFFSLILIAIIFLVRIQ